MHGSQAVHLLRAACLRGHFSQARVPAQPGPCPCPTVDEAVAQALGAALRAARVREGRGGDPVVGDPNKGLVAPKAQHSAWHAACCMRAHGRTEASPVGILGALCAAVAARPAATGGQEMHARRCGGSPPADAGADGEGGIGMHTRDHPECDAAPTAQQHPPALAHAFDQGPAGPAGCAHAGEAPITAHTARAGSAPAG